MVTDIKNAVNGLISRLDKTKKSVIQKINQQKLCKLKEKETKILKEILHPGAAETYQTQKGRDNDRKN